MRPYVPVRPFYLDWWPKLLAVALVLCFAACAPLTGRVLTPDQKYVEALTLFNSVYRTYLDEYDLASPATQAEWKAKIDPAMARASKALDLWGKALKGEGSPVTTERAFRLVKDEALSLLFEYGILRVEE